MHNKLFDGSKLYKNSIIQHSNDGLLIRVMEYRISLYLYYCVDVVLIGRVRGPVHPSNCLSHTKPKTKGHGKTKVDMNFPQGTSNRYGSVQRKK